MKVDDLIESPLSKYGLGSPMGLARKIGAGIRSIVPGSIGQRAKGELDTGRVANEWKKEYMQYVGRAGLDKHGSTESFITFLKQAKKFTDPQIEKVMKGTLSEAARLYERALGKGEIDSLMLRAARLAAASQYDQDADIPDDPSPTAPQDTKDLVNLVQKSKAGGEKVASAAKKIGKAGVNLGKKAFSKKQKPPRVEPTFDMPASADNTSTPQAAPKYTPTKQTPKQAPRPKKKVKPVTKYK